VDRFEVKDRQLLAENDLASAVEWSDLVVLLQAHRQIVGSDVLARASRILDTRGVLSGDNVERL
jgi:UDP-N-acetyl-D-mannosaminuronate dehydrogenase